MKTLIKRNGLATAWLLTLGLCCQANAQDALHESFRNPPAEARPFVRWWWNGDKIEARELDRELDLLKRAGFGGVEINPIAMPENAPDNGAAALVWMSDEWIDLLVHACKKTKDLGMIADMIVGTGWPFGGEFLKADETCQRVIPHVELLKEGATTLKLDPASLLSTNTSELHADRVGSHLSESLRRKLFHLTLVPANCASADEVVNLWDHVDADGIINYKLPDARRYYLCYGLLEQGFRKVTLGAPGGAGPVMDHYKAEVTLAYLSRLKKISVKSGIPLNELLRALFCDSIELSGANWTDGLAKLFLKTYGYDLNPWMPFVFHRNSDGYLKDGYADSFAPQFKENLKRVRYDYNALLVKTFLLNFTQVFQDFCTENKLLCRYQAYGTPFLMGMLDGYMIPDIPESNNWIYTTEMKGPQWTWNQSHGYMTWNMYAASGAHLKGRKIVSCEAMTDLDGVFKATLEEIKQHDDMNFITGMNHSVLHGYNYSPPNVAFPGWIRFGSFFSELNPWWKHLSHWVEYNARLSYLFQNSKPRKSIAILSPTEDLWGDNGLTRGRFHTEPEYLNRLWEPISQLGYSCDYINQGILENATFDDGVIGYGEMKYSLLILASVESVSPRAAEAIRSFAASGGKIVVIDQLPTRSLQMQDQVKQDAMVKTALEKLMTENSASVTQVARPEAMTGLLEWTQGMLGRSGVAPDVAIENACSHVYQIHQSTADKDIYFFANVSRVSPASFGASFSVSGKYPWVWDPETGERAPYPHESESGKLRITLKPLHSLLLVFENEKPNARPTVAETMVKASRTLDATWAIEGKRVDGQSFAWEKQQLQDFGRSSNEVQRTFGGTLIYRTTLKDTEGFTHLDLGNVNEGVTELYVNGKQAGTRWYGEAVYPIADLLRKEGNEIEIHYTTVLANYCKSLKDNAVAQKWTKEFTEPTATGLGGPVKLVMMSPTQKDGK